MVKIIVTFALIIIIGYLVYEGGKAVVNWVRRRRAARRAALEEKQRQEQMSPKAKQLQKELDEWEQDFQNPLLTLESSPPEALLHAYIAPEDPDVVTIRSMDGSVGIHYTIEWCEKCHRNKEHSVHAVRTHSA